MNKKITKLNESTLRKIVAESLKNVLKENHFKSARNRLLAASHVEARRTGRDPNEIYREKLAKSAALSDINKDISRERDLNVSGPYDDNAEFYRAVNGDAFDVDPNRAGIFNDTIDINDDEDFLNEVGNTGPGQHKLGKLTAKRSLQALNHSSKETAAKGRGDKEAEAYHRAKRNDYMNRSLNAYTKARDERNKLPHKIAQQYNGVFANGEKKIFREPWKHDGDKKDKK